jgi:cytochrome b subunit of formate dehydrogenase
MANNELALGAETDIPSEAVADERYFVRLNYSEKVQHIIFAVCFFILVTTGFMLKLPEGFLTFFGQAGDVLFRYRSLLHRSAGSVMILIGVYHIYYLLFKPAGRRWLVDMLPRLKDLKDMRDNFLYFLNVKNKIEYGALIAGTMIMAVTGLILWTQYEWSKFVVDIAALVHGMEAILASLAIMIWHFYEAHFRHHKTPLDNTWLTGVISEEEMKEEYMLHYKKIMNDPQLQKIFIKGRTGEK